MACYYNSGQYYYTNNREIVSTITGVLIISLDEVKANLRIPTADTSEDAYLTLLIQAVEDTFEKATGITLLTTTYNLYYNNIPTYNNTQYYKCALRNIGKPIQSLDSVSYLDNTATYQLLTVETDYVYNIESMYLDVYIKTYQYTNFAGNPNNNIRVVATYGYGDTADDVPPDIKLALIQMVAYAYANNGECSCSADAIPALAQYTQSVNMGNIVYG